MFIGFTFSSLELCITIAALYSTATMLFGGFYANTIPIWLNWLRYGSIVYYGYLNMQMVEFGTGPPIRFVSFYHMDLFIYMYLITLVDI